jgi:hypothetical protein
MLGFSHQADLRLLSLPLRHSPNPHIPNTILNRTHRHTSISKYNIAPGCNRSLREDKLVTMAHLTYPIIILLTSTS